MLDTLSYGLVGLSVLVALWPIIEYFWDRPGLRKYPTQNLLSGLTTLAYDWEIGRKHAINRTRRLYLLHQKKGPVIRVAPNWLSFSTPRAVKDIYGVKSPLLKNEVYFALQENGQHLANMTSKSYHSERRHLVASSYAPKNIEMWEPKIASLAEVLVSKADELCTAPLPAGQIPAKRDLLYDGNKWGLIFAFEGVSKIGLSADLGFVQQGSDSYVVIKDGKKRVIEGVQAVRGYYSGVATLIWDTYWFPWLRKAAGYVSPWFAKSWTYGDDWRDFLTQLVEERLERFESGEELDDLFQPMLEDRRTGDTPDISKDSKIAEMDQMFNGAIDGTGSSLVNTLYYMVRHPDTLRRARAEIDEALGGPGSDFVVAPWSKMKNLPYLKACIDEAQRISPGVAGDLPRKAPPGVTYEVDGVPVPEGTNCSISAYTAQRDPDIFPDPEAFKPERWLIKGEDQLKRMLDVYLVFTMGSRMCMGKSVTILIQTVYLATLLHRYEFALPSPDWELRRTEAFNLWPCDLPLKIWRRQPSTPTLAN